MTHEYTTDRRVALDLNAMLMRDGLVYLPSCGSTQTEVKALLDAGRQPPLVAVCEQQTQGRGRLDRTWIAPERSSVLMSVALPDGALPAALTLQAGMVVAAALRAADVPVRLKWPNDIVVVDGDRMRKLGGILAEVHQGCVVIGVGLNIDIADGELPTEDAISCRQVGVVPSRERLIDRILEGLRALPQEFDRAEYLTWCATVGADVRVSRIAGDPLIGQAMTVDDAGALIVVDAVGAEHRVTVGDVQHVRPRSAS